ncbi:MAG TPA: SusC/RagA family TonB-linked outer membrane protein, partial [Paludibacteraceae bacterium]|nr:SusC/RagA family TonB-linked outer membrane protein [Paludibacteraceae bacterium]
IGASILVKGTTNGTISDYDGKFELQVPDNAILVVSYMGMKTLEVPAKNGMVIEMEADAIVLDDVITVAYATSTRKAFAGSAAVVGSEQMEKKNPTEISKALAGTVAGVQVVNTSGQPGSTASIRIRGIGSINASAAPLYVVDGIPLTGGDLSSIDPSDIATTTILKDATATSLYGSRGANGVVLITTKKGTSGETGKIDVDVKYGINARFIPLYDVITSPERFVELGWEGLRNRQLILGKTQSAAETLASNNLFSSQGLPVAYNMWDVPGKLLIDPTTGKFYTDVQRRYTPENWADHIFGIGQKYEANVKIHGGSDKTTYFTSFGYLKDEGYYIGSDYSRFTARTNIDHQAKKWLKGNVNMAYTYAETNQPGQGDNMNNGFQFVNFMPPIYPVFQRDAAGNIVQDPLLGGNKFDYGMYAGYGRTYAAGVNPAGALQLDKDRTTQHDFTGSAMLEIQFYKDLKLTTNVGLQYVGANNADLTNWFYGDAAGIGRITKTQTNYVALTANQILSYQKTIDKHNLDAFVAHESTLYSVSQMTGQKSNLADPYGLEWSNAVVYGYMESVSESYSLESYFGQARYNYDEKYFVHGTLRGDGSSRFEKGNRWGLFGSIGAAWLMSNEDFLQGSDIVKNLKLKASWGVLGNQELGSFYPTKSV